ncbi:MAG: glycosyltransferase [Rickettsiales bacterium]|jgi:glycosyltransferase involved in cell wall biosynthesis|nr:glycosyltransferase [Rickettsiales bacterium]
MKLSIVVPCFNVAPYLSRAMRSLVNQSLNDIEIICIDDKSTDGTREILRQWAKNDLRIRLIENKKNIGVGPSRNLGIDAATGEYVGFLDPDDFCDFDFYETLSRHADKTGAHAACGQLCVIDINGRKYFDPYRSAAELKKSHHNFKYHYTAIYRRDFLNACKIRYPNLSVNEDCVFETMVKCAMGTSLGFVKGIYYYYCRRAESLNSDCWDDKKIRDSITGVGMICDIYNSSDVSRKDYICGAHGYFEYLCDVTFDKNKNVKTQLMVADALCRVFRQLKFKELIRDKNFPLYLAMMNNDANGVRSVLLAQKFRTKTCSLFGRIPIVKTTRNAVRKDIRLFGVLILRTVEA